MSDRDDSGATAVIVGIDVLTCREDGRVDRKIPETEVLARATSLGRVVLTHDRDDFRRLDRDGLPHLGIVICSYDPDAIRQAARIDAVIAGQASGGRWLGRVDRG